MTLNIKFYYFLLKIELIIFFAVDGDMICVSWLIGEARDRALIATISKWGRDEILQMCPVRSDACRRRNQP